MALPNIIDQIESVKKVFPNAVINLTGRYFKIQIDSENFILVTGPEATQIASILFTGIIMGYNQCQLDNKEK